MKFDWLFLFSKKVSRSYFSFRFAFAAMQYLLIYLCLNFVETTLMRFCLYCVLLGSRAKQISSITKSP